MMDTRTLSLSLFVIITLLCTSCSKGEFQAAQRESTLQASNQKTVETKAPESEPGFFERAKNSIYGIFGGGGVPVVTQTQIKKENKDIKNSKAFCEFANNPLKMMDATGEALGQLVEWRTLMLTTAKSAQECLNSCPNPTNAMKDFCHSLSWCQQSCTTSQIIKNCSTNTAAARDTICVANNCSPIPPPTEYYDPSKILKNTEGPQTYKVEKRTSDLRISKEDLEIRKRIFLEVTRKVVRDFEDKTYTVIFADETSLPDDQIARYSELAKAYQERFFEVKKFLTKNPSANNNYLQHMSETMLCINLPTNAGGENHYLEAMEQNNGCGNAFGLGQVISMTFYSNLGLNLTNYGYNTQNLDKKCKNSPLQFLATECGSQIFQAQFFRIELFDKYLGYTIDELFDRRSFDVELQVRLMFSTIINSFAMVQNWRGAFQSYRGNGTDYYAQFTPSNHACMRTHMSAEYRTESGGEL